VTTLSLAKEDADLAESQIRILIDKRVCAVAVKEIFYHEISDELKAYSDENGVPVFFFSETFFDDIIFTIKTTLLTHRRDFNFDEQIEFLLAQSNSPEQKKRKAKEINPFFYSNIICCYGTLKKNTPWQKEIKPLHLNPAETVYSAVNYQDGVLIIYTTKESNGKKDGIPEVIQEESNSEMETRLFGLLERTVMQKRLKETGISSVTKGLENLGKAVQESLNANTSCRLNQAESLRFQDTGFDRFLLPLRTNFWLNDYYASTVKTLTEYDLRNNTKLLDTMLAYVKSLGDINLTAQKLYQHGNTVRYRIGKIQRLLNLGEGLESFSQMCILARLHEIDQLNDQDE